MQADDRRQGIRRNPRGAAHAAVLEIDGTNYDVLVVDKSIAGVGVLGLNLPPVAVGITGRFTNKISAKEARVASIQEQEWADVVLCRLGLQWVD